MINTTQRVSFQEYTRLPVREIVKGDSNAIAIEVQTPTGKKAFDYNYVSRPFFGADKSVEHPASVIINKLLIEEKLAIEFLLEEWKKTLK